MEKSPQVSKERNKAQLQTLAMQLDLALHQQNTKKKDISLDKINKYVGYSSDTLRVTLNETKGWLKKVQESEREGKTSLFSLGYYIYKRDSGQLQIWSKPSGQLVSTLSSSDIHYVRSSIPMTDCSMPVDYPHMFLLQTTSTCFYLFAASPEERDIWIHDFANFCTVRKETPLNSVRQHVTKQIDQVESRQAQELVKQAISLDQQRTTKEIGSTFNGVQRPFEEQVQSLERKEENKVIKKAQDYVEYVRNESRYFISYSLRIGDQVVEGQLYKKTNSKLVKLVKGARYQMRHVVLNFNQQSIELKQVPQTRSIIQNQSKMPKGFAFGSITHINKAEISIDEKACHFKYKFLIHTQDKIFEFFARTEIEREKWLEYFWKAFDLAQGFKVDFNQPSASYTSKARQRQSTKYDPRRTPNNFIKDGFEQYESAQLFYNQLKFHGHLMKRIDNRKLYHTSNFHKRHFDLNFKRKMILIRQNVNDVDVHKMIPLQNIIRCEPKDSQGANNDMSDNGSRSLPRSRSLLEKIGRKGVDETCQWNYMFVLEMADRNMELYAPTRQDRDAWVRVLSLIIEMNREGITTEDMSPFVYELRKKYQVQGDSQSSRVGIGERGQNQVTERRSTQDTVIKEKVNNWFINNQNLVNIPEGESIYESATMQAGQAVVSGQVVQISQIKTKENCYLESWRAIEGLQKLQLVINNDHGQIELQPTQESADQKQTQVFDFQQLQAVYKSNFKMEPHSLQEVGLSQEFGHSFQINLTQETVILLSSPCDEDRNQWIRLMNLIVEMNELSLDFRIVNPYAYEHHKQKQTTLLIQSSKASLDGAQKTQDQKKVHQIREQLQSKLERNFDDYNSPTMSLTYECVEGFMLKRIEKKSKLRLDRYHLRFFRIEFKLGYMTVKSDLRDKEAKSFWLSGLRNVVIIDNSDEEPQEYEHSKGRNLKQKYYLTADQIRQMYNINERDQTPKWKHCFRLEFYNRNFVLYCMNRHEMHLWINIIKTILQMNQKSIDVVDVNPFVFRQEVEERKTTKTRNSHQRMYSQEEFANQYGTGQTQWDSGPESDWSRENQHTSRQVTVKDAQQSHEGNQKRSQLVNERDRGLGFNGQQLADGLGRLKQGLSHQTQDTGTSNEFLRNQNPRFGQQPLVQNVTYQNITIQQVTMVQRPSTQDGKPQETDNAYTDMSKEPVNSNEISSWGQKSKEETKQQALIQRNKDVQIIEDFSVEVDVSNQIRQQRKSRADLVNGPYNSFENCKKPIKPNAQLLHRQSATKCESPIISLKKIRFVDSGLSLEQSQHKASAASIYNNIVPIAQQKVERTVTPEATRPGSQMSSIMQSKIKDSKYLDSRLNQKYLKLQMGQRQKAGDEKAYFAREQAQRVISRTQEHTRDHSTEDLKSSSNRSTVIKLRRKKADASASTLMMRQVSQIQMKQQQKSEVQDLF